MPCCSEVPAPGARASKIELITQSAQQEGLGEGTEKGTKRENRNVHCFSVGFFLLFIWTREQSPEMEEKVRTVAMTQEVSVWSLLCFLIACYA